MKKKSQNNNIEQMQEETLLDYIDLMLDKNSPDGRLCGGETPTVISVSNNASSDNKVIPISSLLPSANVTNNSKIDTPEIDTPKIDTPSFVAPESPAEQDLSPSRKMPRLLAKFERLLKDSLEQQNQNPLVYTPIDPHELLVRERAKHLSQEIRGRHQKAAAVSKQAQSRVESQMCGASPEQAKEQAGSTRSPQIQAQAQKKLSSLRTQGPFDCLQFTIMGLKLALPLVEVKDIFPVSESLNQLSIESEQLLSLERPDGSEIRVVNTPQLILPERYDDSFLDQIKYVITINGHNWGLAVDDVNQAITLNPNEVRWRTGGGKRSWIAGTVVELMCTLVDTRSMAELFGQDDLNLKV